MKKPQKKKQPDRMTENEFIKRYNRMGYGLYKNTEIKKKIILLHKIQKLLNDTLR